MLGTPRAWSISRVLCLLPMLIGRCDACNSMFCSIHVFHVFQALAILDTGNATGAIWAFELLLQTKADTPNLDHFLYSGLGLGFNRFCTDHSAL